MGLFSKAYICCICQEECDFPKFELNDGNWLCQDCLKDSKISKYEIKNLRYSDVVKAINEQNKLDRYATQMYQYARKNNFGFGWNETWGTNHFRVIAEHLQSDETVLMTFIGLHNYKSTSKHDGHYAYALTDKRFILAQKNLVSGETVQTVYLNNINDITFSSGVLSGILTIDTQKEVFNVELNKDSVKAIHAKLVDVLRELKDKESKSPALTATTSAPTSVADEILKFKQLLDAGIITQDEFDQKKKQLLNL